MEAVTQLRVVPADRSVGTWTDRRGDADDFLDELAREQARFLAAISDARRRLRDESGHLAVTAALHARLTQEFFDAQRCILRQRAETDAAIDDIRTSALRENLADDVQPGVIGDLFAFDEPDLAAARSGLRSVLDQWWTDERSASKRAIDDAHARVAALASAPPGRARPVDPTAGVVTGATVTDLPAHAAPVEPHDDRPADLARCVVPLAHVPLDAAPARDVTVADPPLDDGTPFDAGPDVGSTLDVADVDIPSAAPSAMEVIETLEAAAPGELGSTLDALLASLDDDTSQRTAVDLLDAALVPVSPSPAPDVAAPAVPEAFDRFWQTVEHGRISARDDRARGLISTRVMLPATGVVAAIAVVMAWLG